MSDQLGKMETALRIIAGVTDARLQWGLFITEPRPAIPGYLKVAEGGVEEHHADLDKRVKVAACKWLSLHLHGGLTP